MFKNPESFSDFVSPLNMKETDPDIIDAQIVAGLEAEGGRVCGFINNLDAKFPGGHLREMIEAHGWENSTLFTPEKTSAEVVQLHSQKAAGTTFLEFFRDLDQATEVAGVSSGVLSGLRIVREQAYGQEVGVAQEAYCVAILPVYRELRIKGYSHYDLWV